MNIYFIISQRVDKHFYFFLFFKEIFNDQNLIKISGLISIEKH